MSFFQLIETIQAPPEPVHRADDDPFEPRSALLLQPALFEQALRQSRPEPNLRLVVR